MIDTTWSALGGAHIWLPYTQMKTAAPPLLAIETRGSRIRLADGRALIDGVASWWTACHGYNHPHILAAMRAQLDRMPHVMLSKCAEAAAFRKAFPAAIGALYVKEELADEEDEPAPSPAPPPVQQSAPRASVPKAPASSPTLLEADFIQRVESTMSLEVLREIYKDSRKEGGLSTNALKRIADACQDKSTLIKKLSGDIRDSSSDVRN